MSTTEQDVLKAIKEGMRRALSDATTFTEDFAAAINTEYLATVNIAKAVAAHCPLVGAGDLRVELEMKTLDFATQALPLMSVGGDFRIRSALRKKMNASRNGRVDVAIQKSGPGFERRSWCAIEVKGFTRPVGDTPRKYYDETLAGASHHAPGRVPPLSPAQWREGIRFMHYDDANGLGDNLMDRARALVRHEVRRKLEAVGEAGRAAQTRRL